MVLLQDGLSWVQKKNRNLLLQNCLAKVLESWYVALPGSPLPSLFKLKSHSPRWQRTRGSYIQNIEIHKIYSKIFFFRTAMLICLKFGI